MNPRSVYFELTAKHADDSFIVGAANVDNTPADLCLRIELPPTWKRPTLGCCIHSCRAPRSICRNVFARLRLQCLDRLHLGHATHQPLTQPAVARQGVHALRRRRRALIFTNQAIMQQSQKPWFLIQVKIYIQGSIRTLEGIYAIAQSASALLDGDINVARARLLPTERLMARRAPGSACLRPLSPHLTHVHFRLSGNKPSPYLAARERQQPRSSSPRLNDQHPRSARKIV
jgi:hypothetical protein